jgi:hypothetical protein
MEGLIIILILGWCVWMLIRHPLKSLSLVFKIGFLLVLGIGALAVLLGLIFWGVSVEGI